MGREEAKEQALPEREKAWVALAHQCKILVIMWFVIAIWIVLGALAIGSFEACRRTRLALPRLLMPFVPAAQRTDAA